MTAKTSPYLGRLAPSPTGRLHLGHARTFWVAQQRALAAGGDLLLRNDDLDASRCRPEFVDAFIEDLTWLGIMWRPPIVTQSQRLDRYRLALHQLHTAGTIYPCHRSRREVAEAAAAPHEDGLNDEPLFPPAWRSPADAPLPPLTNPVECNWRFRVPDGEAISFRDSCTGLETAVAGRDFGDFLVWRKDDAPSYQLACAVDDGEMGITEVVRGEDLIKSTFRQLLLLRALDLPEPTYYHAPLMTDDQGERLAKRHDALSLRALREQGITPSEILAKFRP
ncbi:tRNA glutamyl-Q(34) synthetase GluQRS [Synoicihabitans lomoniglobus]|uniref:tRNA glutamyl-Q(34) synthetase GluQRS n=1 Tax=Synoicihabitans lomoniglobus TaxID=2909285 RepID=A0AAE9ZXH3_9BACT|nr:tRNA glutamyl-Q(34) synthetase GluQRS [Opitutaceae bacterium LMO-M01]WED62998.1 tRNA glutamyl-Q(34) synthetase GluQRS [Opitutaceae bacterium LMO-M01]